MIEAVLVEKPEIEKIKEYLKSHYFKTSDDTYFNYEIDADYRDELSEEKLKDIVKSDTPQEVFDDILSQRATDEACDYYYPELISELEKYLDRDLFDAEISWINEHVSWSYEEDHFLNQEMDINLMVATPECKNQDFGCDNILNYCAREEISENSCLLWLAKQFNKESEFRNAVQAEKDSEEELSYGKDDFISSCMQELYNLPSCMSVLTFLIKMSVKDYIKWKEQKADLKIGKQIECGLFDPWSGGGSILEVRLPDAVTIPKDMIYKVAVDGCKMLGRYSDVSDVYGLCSDAWRTNIELVLETEERNTQYNDIR